MLSTWCWLRDDQRLYIVALDAVVEPADAARRQAWNELRDIIEEVRDNVRDSSVTAEELDRTIDEACDEVRYGN